MFNFELISFYIKHAFLCCPDISRLSNNDATFIYTW